MIVSALAGQCTDDMSKAWVDNSDFSWNIKSCAIQYLGKSDLVAKCLQGKYPVLSSECATCFGETVECGKKNCSRECAKDSFLQKCLDCTEKSGCNSNLAKCTGIAQNPPVPTASDAKAGTDSTDGTSSNTRSALTGSLSSAVIAVLALTYF
jgi:hypothetical protein